jgi:hypothetical protein
MAHTYVTSCLPKEVVLSDSASYAGLDSWLQYLPYLIHLLFYIYGGG